MGNKEKLLRNVAGFGAGSVIGVGGLLASLFVVAPTVYEVAGGSRDEFLYNPNNDSLADLLTSEFLFAGGAHVFSSLVSLLAAAYITQKIRYGR